MTTAHDLYYDEDRYRGSDPTYIAHPSPEGADYDLHDALCEGCQAPIAWAWHGNDETDYLTFTAYWETGEESGICEDCYNDWQNRVE